MTKFYMMVGIPGSGKSKIAKELGVKVYASDKLTAVILISVLTLTDALISLTFSWLPNAENPIDKHSTNIKIV